MNHACSQVPCVYLLSAASTVIRNSSKFACCSYGKRVKNHPLAHFNSPIFDNKFPCLPIFVRQCSLFLLEWITINWHSAPYTVILFVHFIFLHNLMILSRFLLFLFSPRSTTVWFILLNRSSYFSPIIQSYIYTLQYFFFLFFLHKFPVYYRTSFSF